MKLALVQGEFKFGNIEENYTRASAYIKKAKESGAETILLPEMWNTYFSKEDMSVKSDREGQRTKKFLSGLALDLNVNIIGGSIAEARGGSYYNTSYAFAKDGSLLGQYSKAHLYKAAGEDKYFSQGNEICTFNLDGIRCGLCICHDISFPEYIRLYALEGVEVLFVPTGWPEEGIEKWLSLTRARAIENQMIVACCNSSGLGSFKFPGRSLVAGPGGIDLLDLGESSCLGLVEVDTGITQDEKTKANLLLERRLDLYEFKSKG